MASATSAGWLGLHAAMFTCLNAKQYGKFGFFIEAEEGMSEVVSGFPTPWYEIDDYVLSLNFFLISLASVCVTIFEAQKIEAIFSKIRQIAHPQRSFEADYKNAIHNIGVSCGLSLVSFVFALEYCAVLLATSLVYVTFLRGNK